MLAEIQLDMFSSTEQAQHGNELILMRTQRMKAHGGPRDMELALARIQLEPHDGQWMWSVSINSANGCGCGYRALPKWGKFDSTRHGALIKAADELRALMDRLTEQEQKRVADWLGSILPNQSA
jgi:hypothetical protein